jgi:hypothetical protein
MEHLIACYCNRPANFSKYSFFFTSWGSFPDKKEKKSFYEKFAGRQRY